MRTVIDITVAALLDAIDGWFADLAEELRELAIWAHRKGSVLFGGE